MPGKRRHPAGKRLEARVDDHHAVESGEILRQAACRGDARSSQRFAHHGQRFILAQHRESVLQEKRQRAMIVVCRKRAFVGLERKCIDHLQAARRKRRQRGAEQGTRDALAPPLRRDHEADDDGRFERFARQRGRSIRMRSKQCGSRCLGCAFSQPTTSAPSKARKPSVAPTSMRARIAVRFCAPESDGQSIAFGTL